ncbi:MAG: tetratricopeptide repeat protein, partial [Myxococcales bacterium]|nr:tetratricopeptide repeat protein [Myxococcales bacterium]
MTDRDFTELRQQARARPADPRPRASLAVRLPPGPDADASRDQATALARQGLRLGAVDAAHEAATMLFEHFGGVALGVLLAEANLHAGDVAAARRLLSGLVAQHTEAVPARVLLAALELTAGETDAALATCEPIADSGPDGTRIYTQTLLAAGREADAREFAMDAVDRHPPDAELFMLLG